MGPKDKKIQIKNEKEDFRILYSINNKIKRDLTVTLDIELSAQREFKFSVLTVV